MAQVQCDKHGVQEAVSIGTKTYCDACIAGWFTPLEPLP